MMATSLEFVPVDIDMADDPKVSYLMDALGASDGAARFAAYGRLMLVLQRVYRRGFYMRYGKFERIKLAKDMGMDVEELDSFLESCIDAELFDASMFEAGVVTSKGIQARYFRARKSRTVSDEDAPYVIDGPPKRDSECANLAESRRESPKAAENRRRAPKNPEERRDTPIPSEDEDKEEEKDQVKRREEKRRARRASSSSNGPKGGDRFPSLREKYPLCCMSVASSPGSVYYDDAGDQFETPLDALRSTYSHRTGGLDWERFASAVASTCPPGCDCSPERAEACARLVHIGLSKFDPSKASNPAPLVRKILADERGRES